jgi:hypothetical protein
MGGDVGGGGRGDGGGGGFAEIMVYLYCVYLSAGGEVAYYMLWILRTNS